LPHGRAPKRAVYAALDLPKLPRHWPRRAVLIFSAFFIISGLIAISLFLRRLSSEIALSDARDAVTLAVNETVQSIMAAGGYGYDDFVTLCRDKEGSICAITTDTVKINALATELLAETVRSADSRKLDIRIPLGNLLGSNLLLGRGPEIPVEILMLTSSFVRLESGFSDTGINQTKHDLILKVSVDIDILVPWETISTTVETDVLIAETILVGRVPDTYVNLEDTHGCIGSES